MKDKLVSAWKNQPQIPIAVGLLGIGASAALGYIYGRNNKKQTVYNVMNATTDKAPAFKMEQAEPDLPDLSKEVEEQVDISGAKEFIEEQVKQAEVRSNIFAGSSDDGWDYEYQVSKRTLDDPYIIHKDEFYANETDFSQMQLTFYQGDNVLVDDDSVPIYDHPSKVGELRFGFGTGGDPNICYIRNEKLKADYEICLDKGLYAVEVMGLDADERAEEADLKHSRSPRKVRPE